ncbi:Uncharacterized protein CG43427 [Gryllus bimaculatus]|nr:Uncharacterized protein CG43427 [Gryllus bimaculatus]
MNSRTQSFSRGHQQYSNENIEYLPARLAKVTTSKPAANPLQFVKVGPCDLYRSAQEQIRKVEQVKKMKAEVRDEAEDWQSNLDNWKSSRRKRQEHIIERVVEVKKLELEEHDRSRRKSKTFSEILEERYARPSDGHVFQLHQKAAGSASQQQQQQQNARRAPASAASVRERLSTLERQADAPAPARSPTKPRPASASRERLGSATSPSRDSAFQAKLANFEGGDSPRSASPGDGSSSAAEAPTAAGAANSNSRRAQLHRSLDSLDVGPGAAASAAADLLSEAFERVQSLQSGDTDREDSGIHTADVSCSVSQADEPVDEAEPAAGADVDADADADVSSSSAVASSAAAAAESDSMAEALDAADVSEETATTVGSEVPPHVDSAPLSPMTPMSPVSPMSPMSPMSPTHVPVAEVVAPGTEQEQLIAVTAAVPLAAMIPPAIPEEPEASPVSGESAASTPTAMAPAEAAPAPAPAHASALLPEPLTPVAAVAPEPPQSAAAPAPKPTPAAAPPAQPAPPAEASQPVEMLMSTSPQPLALPLPPPATLAFGAPLTPLSSPLVTPTSLTSEPLDTALLPPLSLTGEVEIVGGLSFPLGPPTSAEPPKEKPPPPPTELTDDEEPLPAESPLRRLDSTKRIKKEIRRKRSDFLGIAGRDDMDAEEPALTLAPPPDMAALLAEERRLQQQLFRRSLASESDAADAAESRDSGVELERGAAEDAASPEPHSRTNSEIFGHTSLTSEEEEVSRREKEIIANLDQEEQWRRGDSIGEQLAERLRVLEIEKAELDRRRMEEEGIRREEERRLAAREAALRLHEASVVDNKAMLLLVAGCGSAPILFQSTDDSSELQEPLEETPDTGVRAWMHLLTFLIAVVALFISLVLASLQVLISHREALRREQARLDAQREQLRDLEPAVLPTTIQPPQSPQHRWSAGPALQSYGNRQPEMSTAPAPRRPPPPAPPAKPQRVASQEQRERDNNEQKLVIMKWSSRVPSADCLATESNRGNLPTQQSSAVQQPVQPHQMTRQTLQALSAAPRSRLITNDTWIQARRKQEPTRPGLNTQHWLIQEAEHRRLTEQAQRCAPPPRRPPPPQQQWAHHQPPPPPPPPRPEAKPLPDSIIQTLTQRVQGRTGHTEKKKTAGVSLSPNREQTVPLKQFPASNSPANNLPPPTLNGDSQEKMLSVSGKKKCSHCGEELGRGAAMIIESLRLFYHIDCFKCCVCHVQLGDGLMGTDVRVRNSKLHCHNCYSSEDGVKFSCV